VFATHSRPLEASKTPDRTLNTFAVYDIVPHLIHTMGPWSLQRTSVEYFYPRPCMERANLARYHDTRLIFQWHCAKNSRNTGSAGPVAK
jgi:hypothetical protein